ncbi:MAG: TIGR04282 family arsenosugar biosynthesis glycosyltransferase [Caulobacteraceae bacterium]|nr:TIGR04282 family arsenosugar biosynthesis glycosyltransferase [Caulobacter sp.]
MWPTATSCPAGWRRSRGCRGSATSTSIPEAGAPQPRLLVFAKRPRAGEVKTRLAATIGAEAALAAYLDLLGGLLDRLDGAGPWRLELAVSPDDAAGDEGAWPRALPRLGQGGGDLGARMGRLLAQARLETPVLIVGSDVPGLGAAHAAAAFAALARADLVLGPAPDGGYWCIGASRPPPAELFEGVRWSTPHARADTLVNAGALRVEVLDLELEDVDDEASWRRWRAQSRAER